MLIRRANLQDVRQITEVHLECWRSTYKQMFSSEYLQGLSYEKREELWTNVIPNGHVYVAVETNGEIIGFSSGGRERSGAFKEYLGEIYAIYLLENYQRQGIGKKLINSVISDLNELNIYSYLAWVFKGNHSRNFYKALGAEEIASDTCEMDGKLHTEIAYGWRQTLTKT